MQLEQECRASLEHMECARARLPEVDFIERSQFSELIEPVPVGDADVCGRRSEAPRHFGSASLAETFVALGQEVDIRPEDLLTRDCNDLTVESLQPNLEHRSVGFA